MSLAIRPRRPDGRFDNGQPAPTAIGGRPKGVANKLSRDLRAGIIDAAIEHGSDGRGKDGLKGACAFLFREYPKQFIPLLGRLLPLEVRADVTNLATTKVINVGAVPHDRYFTREQVAEMFPPSGPLVIEHVDTNDNEPVAS